MSLEVSIKELTTAVQALVSIVQEQTKLKAVSPVPSIDPAVPEEPTTQKNNIDDLRAFAAALVKADQKGGYDTALGILSEFKAKRFDELENEDYDAVANKFEAAIKKLKKGKGKGAPALG